MDELETTVTEEELPEEEIEEQVEEADELDEDLETSEDDEGWSDDFDPFDEDSEEEEELPEPEAEETTTEEETVEAPVADQPKYKLKHLDTESELTAEEMIPLAQKGMDYDRIRAKYDEMNANIANYEDRMKFLEELAENSGQSVEDMIHNSRAKLLVAREAKNGNKISEADAKERIGKPQAITRKTPEDVRRENFAHFIEEFPDVNSQDIPPEVWADSGAHNDKLTEAWQRHLLKQMDAEIKKLKADNDALIHNKKNQERSTGSRKSTSTKNRYLDEFDKDWYDGT